MRCGAKKCTEAVYNSESVKSNCAVICEDTFCDCKTDMFESLANKMMDYLYEFHDGYTKVIITSDRAELVTSQMQIVTDDIE